MIEGLLSALLSAIKAAIAAVWQFLIDVLIETLDLFLSAVAELIAAIPVPEFLSEGLGGAFAGMGPTVGFFAAALRIPEAFAVLGAGASFRLLRKMLTLGQW